jgi:tetratricopeptide (TPR) repeat protein
MMLKPAVLSCLLITAACSPLTQAIAAEQAAVNPPFNAEALNEQAKRANDEGDDERALQLYGQAVQQDPQFYKAYYNRALIYIRRKDYPGASADLSRAIDVKPDLFQAYANRGNCNLLLGKFKDALADFTHALKLQPSLSEARVGRIQAYMALGRSDEAWQEVTAAKEQGTKVPPQLIAKLQQQSESKDREVTEEVTIVDELGPLRPKNLRSAHKVSGLFVGVSNYPEKSRAQSTPAHTIGAVLFHEIFYRAEANRLGLRIERRPLGGFSSGYRSPPGEVLFSNNGRDYIQIAGASFGRQPQPEIANLRLIADLRIDPRDRSINPGAVVRTLAGIDGSWLQLRDHSRVPVELSPPGHPWPYFGRGNWVSRRMVLESLEESLGRASRELAEPVEFFVFYVAAHGAIDEQGSPFIITASEEAPGAERLYFREVLEVIGRLGKTTSERRLLKIVIFDSCQEVTSRANGQTAVSPTGDLQVPPDTILITSTSPGAYAWHLPSSIRESREVSAKTGGAFAREQKRAFDQEFSSKSSAFPIASHAALQRIQQNSRSITPDQWLSSIERTLPQLLQSVNTQGETQTMNWTPKELVVPWPALFETLATEAMKP